MRRRALSLEAAEAFLLAARLGSFQNAAAELALSPSAVSRRIQTLETFLGGALFDRSAATPRLTSMGRRYLEEIEPALETILQATTRARASSCEKIRLITSHGFALGWLMPRLADLLARQQFDIELTIGRGAQHLRSGEIDVAVWGGLDDAQDFEADSLVELEGTPIAAPVLAGGKPAPATFEELNAHRLLCARSAPNLWPVWLKQAGYTGPVPTTFAEVDNTHFVYESVASGLGVGLAVPLLADRFIKDDKLRPCIPVTAKVPIKYQLIYADPRVKSRADIKAFRKWLDEEIALSVQAFGRWTASHAAN